jgi:hypothetical protein
LCHVALDSDRQVILVYALPLQTPKPVRKMS